MGASDERAVLNPVVGERVERAAKKAALVEVGNLMVDLSSNLNSLFGLAMVGKVWVASSSSVVASASSLSNP